MARIRRAMVKGKKRVKPRVSWTRRILALEIASAGMGTLIYLATVDPDPLNKIALGAIISLVGSVVTFYFVTKD